MKVAGHKSLQIDDVVRMRNPENKHQPRRRLRTQHIVEDRLHQQDAERRHRAHDRHQHDRRQRVQRIRPNIEQQSPDAPQAVTLPIIIIVLSISPFYCAQTYCTQTVRAHLPRHVPVRSLHPVALIRQPLLHLFRNKDRPMLSSGTSKRHRQIALPLLDVMRQKKLQHVRRLVQKLLRLRKLTDILGHLRMPFPSALRNSGTK